MKRHPIRVDVKTFLYKQNCCTFRLAGSSESDWIAVLRSMAAIELCPRLRGVVGSGVARSIGRGIHQDTWHQYQCT